MPNPLRATFIRFFIFPALAIILFIAAMFGFMLPQVENFYHAERRKMVQEIVDASWHHLSGLAKQAAAGKLTRAQAQKRAIAYYRNARYGDEKKDYFWIIDLDANIIMHPYRTGLEGRNLKDYQDPEGVFVFRKMAALAKEKGEGRLSYIWQWPGDPDRMARKTSYVRHFPPWDWVVGTGVYMNDIEQDMASLYRQLQIISGLILALICVALGYLLYRWRRTDRLQQETQQALTRQESHYQTLFETSGDALILFDADMICLDCNQAAMDIFGLPSKESLRKERIESFSDQHQEDSATAQQAALKWFDLAREDGVARLRWNFVDQDQRRFPADITLSLVSPAPEERYLAIIRDVSQQEKMLALLQQEKAFSENIIDSSPAYFVALDVQGKIFMVNRALLDVLGYTRAEVLGKNWTETFVPPENRQAAQSDVAKAWSQGAVMDIENYILCRNGERRRVWWCGRAVGPTANKAGFVFGFAIDVTDQRRAEADLQAREQDLRITLDSIGDAVIATDKEGRITRLNPVAERLTGWKVEEATGRPLAEVFQVIKAETRQPVTNSVERVMTSGRIVGLANSTILIARDGSERQIADSSAPIKDENGQIRGVVLVFRDVTETYRLQEQLRQAQKMEAVGTLAGGIAHDFNNILGAIFGYAQLAQMHLDEPQKIEQHLEMLYLAAQRAKGLVQQILTFSRQGNSTPEPVDIGLITKEALKLLRASLPATIEIQQKVKSDQGLVQVDQTQIYQVIINLCTNAFQAMEKEDGGILTVDLQPVTVGANDAEMYGKIPPGRYLNLMVADTGPGMPAAVLDRIFDPYFTTKEVGEGTGMGLATTHGIVKANGGCIRVYSEPGTGTTFHVFFPLVSETKKTPRPQPPAPFQKGQGHLLLVDDEKALVDIGRRFLEGQGYSVTAKQHPEKALETFQANPETFDLVITDMTMPKMTGDKLARKIREIAPNVPIIICTGFKNKISPEVEYQIGISRILLKPLTLVQLANTIQAVLYERGITAQLS